MVAEGEAVVVAAFRRQDAVEEVEDDSVVAEEASVAAEEASVAVEEPLVEEGEEDASVAGNK